jgi:hypothetical protein
MNARYLLPLLAGGIIDTGASNPGPTPLAFPSLAPRLSTSPEPLSSSPPHLRS